MITIYIYKNGIEVFKSISENKVLDFLKNEKRLREMEIRILEKIDKLYSGYVNNTTAKSNTPKRIFYGNRKHILDNLGKDVYEIYTAENNFQVKRESYAKQLKMF